MRMLIKRSRVLFFISFYMNLPKWLPDGRHEQNTRVVAAITISLPQSTAGHPLPRVVILSAEGRDSLGLG